MRNLLLWLAILLPLTYNAHSQSTSAQVCLSVPQAAKIQDSLKVLPVVRKEAAAWQTSSRFYQQAADSLYKASELNLSAVRAAERAFEGQQLLTQNEFAKANAWKRKARRRGLLNWIGAALVGGAAYFFIAR